MQNAKSIKKTKYALIFIKHNIANISECVDLAKQIDSYIERNKIFLILRFDENLIVTGSVLGFLAARINKIKKLQGKFVVVTTNQDLRELLQITSLDTQIQVFPSVKEFLNAFPNVDFELE